MSTESGSGVMLSLSLRGNNINPILGQHLASIVVLRREVKVFPEVLDLDFSDINRVLTSNHAYIKSEIAALVVAATQHCVQANLCDIRRAELPQGIRPSG